MKRRKRSEFLALSVALMMLLAACNGTTTATTEAPGTTAASDTTAAPDTTAASDTTEATPVSGEPIRIGMLTDVTSTFAPWGVQVRDGMLMAAEEINAAGGVDGRMVEIIEADSQNDADASAEALERLIEDGVVAVGGIISSGVAVPTAALAEQLQIPLFTVKGGSDQVLTADSRFTFRSCLPAAPMDAGPILQYAQEQGLSSVGAIIADYAWGQSISSAMETTFEGSDVAIQIEVAPVPETDFTTYLRSLQDFGAEMIVATGHPPGSGPITAQSSDFFNVPVTGAWTPFSLVVGALAEAAIDRYADFACADYVGSEYEEMARRYLEFSDNTFMADDAVAGHGIVTMVADAVANVGDDPVAIAEYLHGQSYDLEGYAHEVSWTEWGELAAAQPKLYIVTAGPPPEGVSEAGEWWLEELVHSEPLEPFVPGS
ncbi:MAG: ABC transporter substrate-binding protein [Acidimicrobiia bacterium]